ncbi:hypothetical protein V8E52_004835 [Russula decolorans]
MVNLHMPVLDAETGLVVVMLWHVMGGIYFWEFITTLDYEWRVIRGRLPHWYSIWIYSLTRVACLLGVIVCYAGLDAGTSINCQLWISSMAVLTDAASIAIWNRNKAVTATSIIIWVTGFAFRINDAVRVNDQF